MHQTAQTTTIAQMQSQQQQIKDSLDQMRETPLSENDIKQVMKVQREQQRAFAEFWRRQIEIMPLH